MHTARLKLFEGSRTTAAVCQGAAGFPYFLLLRTRAGRAVLLERFYVSGRRS